jgi:hypothetical protein
LVQKIFAPSPASQATPEIILANPIRRREGVGLAVSFERNVCKSSGYERSKLSDFFGSNKPAELGIG